MTKKILSILLCAAMVLTLSVPAFAAEAKYETIEGEYTYTPSLGFLDFVGNQTGYFTYSDEYFTHSGYEYDHDLAIMTMCFNTTCFASADSAKDGWETAPSNFNALMAKLGFVNIDCNEYAASHPERESIGAYAASKALTVNGKDYTLIALGVRGHNYGGEWYSNLKAGAEGDHAGFADARDKVLSFLKDYIAEYNIKGNVKIWLTGYSRAAITANMVGGYIDKGFDMGKNVKFDTRDLYCYTFEAPQGTSDEHAHDAIYGNIFNIINSNDIVPLVSFTEWGHTRYGVDINLPCRQYDDCYAELKPAVEAKLKDMGWMTILGMPIDTIDDFHYLSLNPVTAVSKADMTQIEFYDEAFAAMFNSLAPSREYYVEYLQADLQELIGSLSGFDADRVLQALTIFCEKFTTQENLSELLDSLTIEGMEANGSLVDITVDLFLDAMREAKCSSYNADQVRAMLENLVPKFLVFVKENPDTALTLMGNLLQIVNAHFPEIVLTWMRETPAIFFETQNTSYVNGVCTYNGDKLPDVFGDVKAGSWCFDAVNWAVESGIAAGFSSESFAPNAVCTRAQAVTFLWRAAGSPEPMIKLCPFTDISSASPYYKAILWAVENGITAGTDLKHFSPNESCTRAQIVTFLWRYEGRPVTFTKCAFEDVSSTSPYYMAILWASENGITAGVDATHFAPSDNCTRAQIVSFLYRDMAKL